MKLYLMMTFKKFKWLLLPILGLFIITFTVYMLNLDGKFINKKHDEMQRFFDKMERDSMI